MQAENILGLEELCKCMDIDMCWVYQENLRVFAVGQGLSWDHHSYSLKQWIEGNEHLVTIRPQNLWRTGAVPAWHPGGGSGGGTCSLGILW